MGYRLRAAIAALRGFWLRTGRGAFALPPSVAAVVVDLQRSGERKPALDTSSVAAHARDDLSRGAFVRSGPASKMALVFANQTQVRLNQNSLLQVKASPAPTKRSPTCRAKHSTRSTGVPWTRAFHVGAYC